MYRMTTRRDKDAKWSLYDRMLLFVTFGWPHIFVEEEKIKDNKEADGFYYIDKMSRVYMRVQRDQNVTYRTAKAPFSGEQQQ